MRKAYNAYMREYLKRWRREKEDKDKVRARGERHRLSHLDKFAEKERKRRKRIKQNGGHHSDRDWLRLVRRYSYKCAYCFANSAETKDHVIPVSRGGSSFIGNILPSCLLCNSKKQNKLLSEWKHGKG